MKELFSVTVRELTPQWEVHEGTEDGPIIARVTERVIAELPYIVCFVDPNTSEDTGSVCECKDRDAVMDAIGTTLRDR